ncbi:MAG: hypothetical protein Q8K72_22145, partial [Acidimicrobiales bacterium]|nr:hypothetical protein [Acidimicrobiales bacterium]
MTLFGVPSVQDAGRGRPRLVALPGAREQDGPAPARQPRAEARRRRAHPTGLGALPSRVTPAQV